MPRKVRTDRVELRRHADGDYYAVYVRTNGRELAATNDYTSLKAAEKAANIAFGLDHDRLDVELVDTTWR